MENITNTASAIPIDYVELIQYIDNNRQRIIEDWSLLIEVLRKLEDLLRHVTSMADLHKDAAIMLHVIRMEQDKLLKDIRNELTLERVIQISETELMEGFFTYVKGNTQAIEFVDSLVLNYEVEEQPQRKDDFIAAVESVDSEQTIEDTTEDENLHEIGDILKAIRDMTIQYKRIEFFRLIMDRTSYSKTLINAFNLALALRRKVVSLDLKDGTVFVTPYDSSNQQDGHSVFEITQEQYNELNSRFE